MKFHEISLHEISFQDFCTSIERRTKKKMAQRRLIGTPHDRPLQDITCRPLHYIRVTTTAQCRCCVPLVRSVPTLHDSRVHVRTFMRAFVARIRARPLRHGHVVRPRSLRSVKRSSSIVRYAEYSAVSNLDLARPT